MTKTQIKAVITTQAGFTATADDTVKDGQGSSAYTAMQAHRDVYIDGTYIPFDAIDHAVVTITQATVDDPEDPTCQTEG